MSLGPITPCIWLADHAEAAAAFYTGLLPAGRVVATSRYPEGSDNPARRPRGSVLTIEIEVAGQRLTLLNGGPIFRPNPSVSFFVYVESPAEADRLFAAFAEGGTELMPIGAYPWSARYGWVSDRFGVSWQVMTTPDRPAATIATSLMFCGDVAGRAEEALTAYAAIFPRSRVESARHHPEVAGRARTLLHGRATIDGQEIVAMDNLVEKGFGFTEGLSLQARCADQAEVDRVWAALGDGGRPGVCGWLHDRFGVSWQVVPAGIAAWMTSPDVAARERAFAAMMTMTKPDIAALARAFAGT